MTSYVALLRAVNVGGTGKLPMADLVALCRDLGFADVRTYIASGNVIFADAADVTTVAARLDHALQAYAGRAVGVIVRDAAAIARVVTANPFAGRPGNRVIALFTDSLLSATTLDAATGVADEAMRLGEHVVYIDYPGGMGTSRLRLPVASTGTARNMNTVSRLATMAAD